MNQKPNYGNWVPEKLLYLTFGGAALFLVLALLSGLAFSNTPLAVICAILCAVLLAFGIYMYACHECFAFGKGDMMAKVHAHLVAHLNWDGHGTLLDIGCGAAPLTVRCAKAFPDAALIGMDYWGAQWNYAKEQCEKNAAIEGVASRIHFEKGDAAHLNYADETFDAAVSNFVFHEVHSARDKRDVVREALRVVKRGGAFSFQDLFAQKSLYGDMDAFVADLHKEGISEHQRHGHSLREKITVPYSCASTSPMSPSMQIERPSSSVIPFSIVIPARYASCRVKYAPFLCPGYRKVT